jgi:hypothetical protein
VSQRFETNDREQTSAMTVAIRWAIVLVAGALGSYWRLAPVGSAFLFGDEFHSLRLITSSYSELFSSYGRYGSGLLLPPLQRALGELFGNSHWTMRLPAWLPGLILLWSCCFVGARRFGRHAAALGTVLVAGSSLLVFYSHFGRSYMLVAALSSLLVMMLQRIVDDGLDASAEERYWPSKGRLVLCALITALLPYAHLIAVGLVVPLYGAAWLTLIIQPKTRSLAWMVLLPLVVGGLLCCALSWPAWDSYQAFVASKTERSYFGSFGLWDVMLVLAGSYLGGVVLFVLSLAGMARLAMRWRWRALPLLAGCLGPVAALWVAQPYGDAYAWARYLIPALPVALCLIGWLLCDTARALCPTRDGADRSSLLAGVGLALLFAIPGPLGAAAVDDGPFANCYLGLAPLPAFDSPWPDMPPFYGELAEREEPLRVLEVPGLFTRSRQLLRNYHLVHGQSTWLALPKGTDKLPEIVPLAGPYISLSDPAWLERAIESVDVIIVHREPAQEVQSYWKFLYPRRGEFGDDPALSALMERQSKYFVNPKQMDKAVTKALREKLGPPSYRDSLISAWELP